MASYRWLGRASLRFVVVALVLLAFRAPGNAQEGQDEWTVTQAEIDAARSAPLFQSDEPLELTLFADFNVILERDREGDPEDRPALVRVASSGSERTIGLKVETRGNWRLDPDHCAFPPIWLDFDKDDKTLLGTVFEGQNKLKLYVTCQPGRTRHEEYIYTEYLIYSAYNELTDLSFRARPARVTYVDTSGRGETFTANAFILEHKSQMAARNGAKPIELAQLHPANISQEAAALVELFNYAIGMTDYSPAFMHNIELIQRSDGELIPISYDFDWSGTVNARYAKPSEKLPIRNVRQRIFRGICRNIDYGAIFQRFNEAREGMLFAVRDFEGLDQDRKDGIVEYWEEFFEIAADEGRHKVALRDCQPMPP